MNFYSSETMKMHITLGFNPNLSVLQVLVKICWCRNRMVVKYLVIY